MPSSIVVRCRRVTNRGYPKLSKPSPSVVRPMSTSVLGSVNDSGPQQQGVRKAEDGCAAGDSHRKRENGGDCEDRAPRQQANRVAKVRCERHVAIGLLVSGECFKLPSLSDARSPLTGRQTELTSAEVPAGAHRTKLDFLVAPPNGGHRAEWHDGGDEAYEQKGIRHGRRLRACDSHDARQECQRATDDRRRGCNCDDTPPASHCRQDANQRADAADQGAGNAAKKICGCRLRRRGDSFGRLLTTRARQSVGADRGRPHRRAEKAH